MSQVNSLVSVVIRTLNEDRHLEELLVAIRDQRTPDFDIEVVLVDSGSTDSTLPIAEKHGCRITHIKKSEFTCDRALRIVAVEATTLGRTRFPSTVQEQSSSTAVS